jgi:hypothetical protein
MTWPIGFSSLIGCPFLILEEAVNPESAKDSVCYRKHVSSLSKSLRVLFKKGAIDRHRHRPDEARPIAPAWVK